MYHSHGIEKEGVLKCLKSPLSALNVYKVSMLIYPIPAKSIKNFVKSLRKAPPLPQFLKNKRAFSALKWGGHIIILDTT